MEFGIAVASSTESWRLAQRAEELGFTHVWFYDTQLLNPDVFVCMALAAERTSRITLATGVLVPSNRIAPVAANCLATLNRLAPGRIKLGVGTGFTARRTMGLDAIRRVDLRRYVETVTGLLRGETVEAEIEGKRRLVRFLNPELDLIRLMPTVPLSISAMGPKMRRLVAEMEAELLFFGGTMEQAEAAMQDMKEAWREAGLAAEDLSAVIFSLGCVLTPGEAPDSERARAQAGPLVAAVWHGLVESPELQELRSRMPPPLLEAVDRYRQIWDTYDPPEARYLTNHRGHMMFVRPEEEKLLSPDLLQNLAWVGTERELRERVAALANAGYTQATVQIVEGHEDAIEDWARVFGLTRDGTEGDAI